MIKYFEVNFRVHFMNKCIINRSQNKYFPMLLIEMYKKQGRKLLQFIICNSFPISQLFTPARLHIPHREFNFFLILRKYLLLCLFICNCVEGSTYNEFT